MTMKSLLIDRRAFLTSAGFMAGAVVATTLVPLSVVHALPSNVSLSGAELAGEGHVDDVCGHWPPYAHPIGYGHVEPAPSVVAHVDAIDHILMA